MQCHVCHNEIIVFTPAKATEPIPPAAVKIGQNLLFFCSGCEELIENYERAAALIELVRSGDVLPPVGMAVQETVHLILKLGVQ